MSPILLVASREYKQITSTRGFWVLLLFVPLIIAVMQIGGRFVQPPRSSAYMIVDASGEYADAIQHRIDVAHQRQVLGDLAGYVERWELGAYAPASVAGARSGFSDEDVEAFMAQGGADAAIKEMSSHLTKDAADFAESAAPYVRAPTPPDIAAAQGVEAVGTALQPVLERDVQTVEGKIPVELAIYIPPGFADLQAPAQVWTSGRPDQGLIALIRAELTRMLKDRALLSSGLSPEIYARIEAMNAPLALSAPPQGGGRDRVRIRSLLPLALSYLLLMTVMTTGGLMLQGVLEERSNRLLESVLACISPGQLMYGKLFGLGGVGMTIILVWLGFALGAMFMVQGAVADFLRPSLAAFDQPWVAPALLFYFITGYLIISMIYLAIGALSTSLQDAQAYLMPVIFVITLPIVFMMISVVQDPDGLLPRVLSWIPIYTPFAMLGRLGGGVALPEVLGTGALLIVFVMIEMFALGKLFQDSILRTGQPPALVGLLKLMGRKPAAKPAP